MTEPEKIRGRHANSRIFQGYCPNCNQRSLKYPRDLNYGGLMCYNPKCSWKNIYRIDKTIKKGSSSSDQNKPKPKPNNAIIIDMTGRYNKRYQTGICYECDHSKYPNGKVIDPTVDKMAQKLDNGKWICGTCQIERSLTLFGKERLIE